MGLESEYSIEFDKLRKNRVEVSYFKYGAARKNFGEGRVDALATAELCIEAFKKDQIDDCVFSILLQELVEFLL